MCVGGGSARSGLAATATAEKPSKVSATRDRGCARAPAATDASEISLASLPRPHRRHASSPLRLPQSIVAAVWGTVGRRMTRRNAHKQGRASTRTAAATHLRFGHT